MLSLFLFVLLWLLSASFASAIAQTKGRFAFGAFLLGLAIGPFALAVAVGLAPDRYEVIKRSCYGTQLKVCRHCYTTTPASEHCCKSCHTNFF